MYSPCGRSTKYERIFAVGPRGNVSESKLSCRNVWKLFGPDPQGFLRSHDGHPSPEQVKKAGYISAVYDASLEVYEGEILVLMGLSGSGKSTLVRCLSRLIEPTAGEMLFDGSDLLAATDKEMIETMQAAQEALAATLAGAGALAADHGDTLTEDLCIARGQEHEKFAWFLRSHLA